jgi:hypothetical protein
MNPQQTYIDSLLEAISNEPFSSDDQRETLIKLKEHLAAAPDLEQELKRLFRVEGFSHFALSLMWVRQELERNPERQELTADDQYLVSMKLRQAFGDVESPLESSEPAVTPDAEVREPQPEAPKEAPVEPQQPTVAYLADAPEETFPQLLEKFVIAMQAGVDDRTRLFERIMSSAGEIGQPESEYSSDLQELCANLVAFLSYVKGNNFMDDVRTMNILSSVSGAVATWSAASIEIRAGLLAEGIKTLAEAKSHFE